MPTGLLANCPRKPSCSVRVAAYFILPSKAACWKSIHIYRGLWRETRHSGRDPPHILTGVGKHPTLQSVDACDLGPRFEPRRQAHVFLRKRQSAVFLPPLLRITCSRASDSISTIQSATLFNGPVLRSAYTTTERIATGRQSPSKPVIKRQNLYRLYSRRHSSLGSTFTVQGTQVPQSQRTVLLSKGQHLTTRWLSRQDHNGNPTTSARPTHKYRCNPRHRQQHNPSSRAPAAWPHYRHSVHPAAASHKTHPICCNNKHRSTPHLCRPHRVNSP